MPLPTQTPSLPFTPPSRWPARYLATATARARSGGRQCGLKWLSLAALALALSLGLAGCAGSPTKEEEAAKNTTACLLNGERILIRFDAGEARLLMPGGDRVTLYQIATASGLRYTNGLIELRGKGMDLQFLRDGFAYSLEECAPYTPPK